LKSIFPVASAAPTGVRNRKQSRGASLPPQARTTPEQTLARLVGNIRQNLPRPTLLNKVVIVLVVTVIQNWMARAEFTRNPTVLHSDSGFSTGAPHIFLNIATPTGS
jgi:hypothetical protein